MLSFDKMENYYKLITAIEKYEILIRTDDGLKAYQIAVTPHATSHDPHKIEKTLIDKEKIERNLPLLKAKKEHNLPLIEATIQEATENCSLATGIKRKMIFQMRYIQGMEWGVIEDCLQVKNAKQTILQALERKK